MSKVSNSLQKQLIQSAMLSSIAAGLIALILLLAFTFYQSMDTQDQIMDEISDMLLITDIRLVDGRQVDQLSDEFEIAYQLKYQQQVMTQSASFPVTLENSRTFAVDDQYAFVWQDQMLWRSYQYYDAQRQLQVQLYQPMSERFSDFFQNVAWYALGLIILWLLQWGLLHFAVKKHFRSIQRLSNLIAEKNVEDLSSIQDQAEFIELQPMVKQLNLLLQRLQQSLIAEQRLTADAAHELRSPLSAIQMRLQVLQRKYADQLSEIEPYLVLIQQDVQRGTQILENLLLLARLDPTDPYALPKCDFDFAALISEVMQSLDMFAQDQQVELLLLTNSESLQITQSQDSAAEAGLNRTTLNVNHRGMLLGNRELLFICLRNLIDNAIRYSADHGHVYMQYQYIDGQLIFKIEDDGPHLSPAVLQRMGERFYRALGTKTQGTGLGLSICKKIIELHQAKMEFKRSEYGGLAVVIYFHQSAKV